MQYQDLPCHSGASETDDGGIVFGLFHGMFLVTLLPHSLASIVASHGSLRRFRFANRLIGVRPTMTTVAVTKEGYLELPHAVGFGEQVDDIDFDLSEKEVAHYYDGIDPSGNMGTSTILPRKLVPFLPLLPERRGARVVGAFIDAISWDEATARIMNWADARESRYVCICNVHSVVTARQDADFSEIISKADMATPDGMPVAWTLQRKGSSGQQRINGPDLMWRLCSRAGDEDVPIFLLGATEDTLSKLQRKLGAEFPALKIAGVLSPPFRPLQVAEQVEMVKQINESGAGLIFVGLGCPKQERLMAALHGKVNAVMIGVGAAFNYHAGVERRAPRWMQDRGLEWLYRLVSNPRRLWKRYFVTNSLFILWALQELLSINKATDAMTVRG